MGNEPPMPLSQLLERVAALLRSWDETATAFADYLVAEGQEAEMRAEQEEMTLLLRAAEFWSERFPNNLPL